MTINNLSFITPSTETAYKLNLKKEYSQSFKLNENEEIYLSSHPGLNNKDQQDTLGFVKNNEYLLLILADGIGGMDDGNKASYQTVKTIKELFEFEDPKYLKELDENLFEQVIYTLMYEIIKKIPPYSGTTLNLSVITKEKTYIANVGNSRIYTLKDDFLLQETFDDSYAFRKFTPGTVELRDLLRFYKRNNELTDAIMHDHIPYIKTRTINNKDYQILCHLTDGITSILEHKEILNYLKDESPADKLVTNSIYGNNYINKRQIDHNFCEILERGTDNSTALVYKKRR